MHPLSRYIGKQINRNSNWKRREIHGLETFLSPFNGIIRFSRDFLMVPCINLDSLMTEETPLVTLLYQKLPCCDKDKENVVMVILLVGGNNVTTVLLGAEIKMSNGFPDKDYHFTLHFACLIYTHCLLYTSPSPRDKRQSRMPSSA